MLPFSWVIFCALLPWHRLRFVKRLIGPMCFLARCQRCGREYCFNDDVRIVLPYYVVKDFYDGIEEDINEAIRKGHNV